MKNKKNYIYAKKTEYFINKISNVKIRNREIKRYSRLNSNYALFIFDLRILDCHEIELEEIYSIITNPNILIALLLTLYLKTYLIIKPTRICYLLKTWFASIQFVLLFFLKPTKL